MAQSVRLIDQDGRSLIELGEHVNRIIILAVDEFGLLVSEMIAEKYAETTLRVENIDEIRGELGDCKVILMASGHPCQSECETLNKIAYDAKLYFVPTWIENSILTIGPFVDPLCGACWSCYNKRISQHDQAPEIRRAVNAHYSNISVKGPGGMLPSVGHVAAHIILPMLTTLWSESIGGTVVRLDLGRLETSKSRVVSVSGCRMCGLKREPSDQSWSEIVRSLDWLWSNCEAL